MTSMDNATSKFFFTKRPPWLHGASWSNVKFVWPPAFFTSAGAQDGIRLGGGNWDWEVSRNSNVLLQKLVLKEYTGRFFSYNSLLCNSKTTSIICSSGELRSSF